MQTLLQSYKAQAIILLFIWIVSMVLSAEFVLSLSMIGLVLLSIFQLKIDGPYVRFTFRDNLKENFRQLWKYKAWIMVSILFLIVLISAVWSSDLEYTLERLRIKLPFLVLPFAFASMPKLTKKRNLYDCIFPDCNDVRNQSLCACEFSGKLWWGYGQPWERRPSAHTL